MHVCLTTSPLDVHDPTTGEIRSSSTDDIACWFIDTDYNVKVVKPLQERSAEGVRVLEHRARIAVSRVRVRC